MIGNEHKYLRGFVDLQRQLIDVPDDQVCDFLNYREAPFAYSFFDEYKGRELVAHSVGSLVIKDEAATQTIFGEVHHIGELDSLVVQIDYETHAKKLCLVFDAAAIALPPGIDFEPFYQSVHIPVAGLESIVVA